MEEIFSGRSRFLLLVASSDGLNRFGSDIDRPNSLKISPRMAVTFL